METIIVKGGFPAWSLVCSNQTPQIQYIYSAFIVHEEKIDSFTNSPHLFLTPKAKNDQTFLVQSLVQTSFVCDDG